MDRPDLVISVPSGVDALRTALENAFPRLKETHEKKHYELFDTFDWRLYHNDLQLLKEDDHVTVACATSGAVVGDVRLEGRKERRFSWDFPVPAVADHLGPVLEMRAVIPIADIEKQLHGIAVCNGDDKTVARIEVETLTTREASCRAIRCRLLPVKGYEREARNVGKLIEDLQFPEETVPAVIDLLMQSGITPGAYSSKVDVALQPEMPAPRALQLILKNLVSVMEQNLGGVREDIDTEFLHDFRVAIRRARSLLGQTKGVLDGETTNRLQTHLKYLGGISGDVRDLDVYLLKKETYVSKVPEVLRPGILQLFRSLSRRRRRALDRMLKSMAGEAFHDAMKALDAFLQSDPMPTSGDDTVTPVGDLARKVIYKRFRRVIREGRRITAETPDEMLHDLRIDCKKLRYLLEFFTSLFPEDEMKRLIKQLKRLQENLGDFNDLSVQKEFLEGVLATVRPQTEQSLMLAAATGGLITRLDIEHRRVRSEFMRVFEAFSSQKNQARFKALFT